MHARVGKDQTGMLTVLPILALLFVIVSTACGIGIVVEAFRKRALDGILCLVVPFYAVYWAMTQFDHPRRRAIIWAWLASPVAALVVGGAPIAYQMMTVTR